MKYLKTSEIAKEVKVHPNTVRLYEEWGLLQAVQRNDKGYRLYTKEHLEQMRLARIALRCEFIVANIREHALDIIRLSAKGQGKDALKEAHAYLAHIKEEIARAEEALKLAQGWLEGSLLEDSSCIIMKRREAAEVLGITIDVLRDWERNGLIEIPRDPYNGYRIYGPRELSRLKVIRALRRANYSMMSILRMINHIDRGTVKDLKESINTPDPEEDIIYATDRLISTLKETERDAYEVIKQLKRMYAKEI